MNVKVNQNGNALSGNASATSEVLERVVKVIERLSFRQMRKFFGKNAERIKACYENNHHTHYSLTQSVYRFVYNQCYIFCTSGMNEVVIHNIEPINEASGMPGRFLFGSSGFSFSSD